MKKDYGQLWLEIVNMKHLHVILPEKTNEKMKTLISLCPRYNCWALQQAAAGNQWKVERFSRMLSDSNVQEDRRQFPL